MVGEDPERKSFWTKHLGSCRHGQQHSQSCPEAAGSHPVCVQAPWWETQWDGLLSRGPFPKPLLLHKILENLNQLPHTTPISGDEGNGAEQKMRWNFPPTQQGRGAEFLNYCKKIEIPSLYHLNLWTDIHSWLVSVHISQLLPWGKFNSTIFTECPLCDSHPSRWTQI